MIWNRKTRDYFIVALTVASGVVVLAPSMVAAAASLFALAKRFFT